MPILSLVAGLLLAELSGPLEYGVTAAGVECGSVENPCPCTEVNGVPADPPPTCECPPAFAEDCSTEFDDDCDGEINEGCGKESFSFPVCIDQAHFRTNSLDPMVLGRGDWFLSKFLFPERATDAFLNFVAGSISTSDDALCIATESGGIDPADCVADGSLNGAEFSADSNTILESWMSITTSTNPAVNLDFFMDSGVVYTSDSALGIYVLPANRRGLGFLSSETDEVHVQVALDPSRPTYVVLEHGPGTNYCSTEGTIELLVGVDTFTIECPANTACPRTVKWDDTPGESAGAVQVFPPGTVDDWIGITLRSRNFVGNFSLFVAQPANPFEDIVDNTSIGLRVGIGDDLTGDSGDPALAKILSTVGRVRAQLMVATQGQYEFSHFPTLVEEQVWCSYCHHVQLRDDNDDPIFIAQPRPCIRAWQSGWWGFGTTFFVKAYWDDIGSDGTWTDDGVQCDTSGSRSDRDLASTMVHELLHLRAGLPDEYTTPDEDVPATTQTCGASVMGASSSTALGFSAVCTDRNHGVESTSADPGPPNSAAYEMLSDLSGFTQPTADVIGDSSVISVDGSWGKVLSNLFAQGNWHSVYWWDP